MRYGLALVLLSALPCFGQTTGKAETAGPCSPAVSGSKNTFTIKCGIDEKQGQAMLKILNEILRNELDPNAVMKKLDEIQKGIRQLTDREWAELTKIQIQTLCNSLGAPGPEKVQVQAPNEDENRLLLANQIAEGFRCAKWNVEVGSVMELRAANSPIPAGIEMRVKEDSPSAEVVAGALINVFGQDKFKGYLVNDAQPGLITISVYYKPK